MTDVERGQHKAALRDLEAQIIGLKRSLRTDAGTAADRIQLKQLKTDAKAIRFRLEQDAGS